MAPLLALLLLLALAPRAVSPQAVGATGLGRWQRLLSKVAAPGRSGHVAAANGTHLLVAGGAGAGGPEGSTTVVAVDRDVSGGGGGRGSSAFVQQVVSAAAAGLPAVGRQSLTNAAFAAVHDSSWDALPSPRAQDYLLAFGGTDGGSSLQPPVGALYKLSLATGQWSVPAVNASSPAPSPRILAAGVFLNACANWTGTEWGCFIVHGGSAGGNLLDDADVLFLSNTPGAPQPRWFSPARIAGAAGPGQRIGHSLVATPAGDRAYMFGGGTTVGSTNDVYVLAPNGFPDAQPSEMTNLALGKAVTSSSRNLVSGAEAVVTDGRTSGVANFYFGGPNASVATNPGYNTCFRTNSSDHQMPANSEPWVRIDLGSPQSINAVLVFTRTDCKALGNLFQQIACQVSMQNFVVYTGGPAAAAATTPSDPLNRMCSGGKVSPANGQALVPCAATNVRYVWVAVPGVNRTLTVCEVEVLQTLRWAWRQLSGTYNAALYQPQVLGTIPARPSTRPPLTPEPPSLALGNLSRPSAAPSARPPRASSARRRRRSTRRCWPSTASRPTTFRPSPASSRAPRRAPTAAAARRGSARRRPRPRPTTCRSSASTSASTPSSSRCRSGPSSSTASTARRASSARTARATGTSTSA